METYEVLEKAADILDEYGQCKGSYRSADGKVCARGAIRVALFGTTDLFSAAKDRSEGSYFEKYDALYNLAEKVEIPFNNYLDDERPARFEDGDTPNIAVHNDGMHAIGLEPHPNMAEAMRLCAKQLRAESE